MVDLLEVGLGEKTDPNCECTVLWPEVLGLKT